MFYFSALNTIESILIIGTFIILFMFFINEKYPLKVFSNPIISASFILLVALHGNNVITFIFDEEMDYLKLFLFVVSVLTFSLKAFIFRI